MDSEEQLYQVLQLFRRLELDVREEYLGGDSGGLCQLRGKRVIFVDLDADVATRLDRCLTALAMLPELDDQYIPPALREQIDRLRA